MQHILYVYIVDLCRYYILRLTTYCYYVLNNAVMLLHVKDFILRTLRYSIWKNLTSLYTFKKLITYL